jgi:hypothetical protein
MRKAGKNGAVLSKIAIKENHTSDIGAQIMLMGVNIAAERSRLPSFTKKIS